MKKIGLALCALLVGLYADSALAWHGYDDSGREVEIHKGNLVRRGRDIEVYDPYSNTYRSMQVDRVRQRGRDVEVEVFDWQTGKSQTLHMEGYQKKKQRYGR